MEICTQNFLFDSLNWNTDYFWVIPQNFTYNWCWSGREVLSTLLGECALNLTITRSYTHTHKGGKLYQTWQSLNCFSNFSSAIFILCSSCTGFNDAEIFPASGSFFSNFCNKEKVKILTFKFCLTKTYIISTDARKTICLVILIFGIGSRFLWPCSCKGWCEDYWALLSPFEQWFNDCSLAYFKLDAEKTFVQER